jgi:F0F1-type ATP synthase delta subunit
LLVDPTQNRDVKIAGINKLSSKGKYSETTMNLMNLLAENGHLQETPKIIEAYKALIMAHCGEVLAVVTSAKPLDNTTLKQLKDTLRKSSFSWVWQDTQDWKQGQSSHLGWFVGGGGR